ncbi:hypothetical protein AAFF_G00282180 [Aldrovandia affinis]|uniref:Uncharacterized protein n=1 Tax=Aldrovandia affinis TaxID=143900 RepID=A0AAD7TBB8_9TELE|nr:hypothetical protein AAFF_G00282180 [Aldrovandia affinis]
MILDEIAGYVREFTATGVYSRHITERPADQFQRVHICQGARDAAELRRSSLLHQQRAVWPHALLTTRATGTRRAFNYSPTTDTRSPPRKLLISKGLLRLQCRSPRRLLGVARAAGHRRRTVAGEGHCVCLTVQNASEHRGKRDVLLNEPVFLQRVASAPLQSSEIRSRLCSDAHGGAIPEGHGEEVERRTLLTTR